MLLKKKNLLSILINLKSINICCIRSLTSGMTLCTTTFKNAIQNIHF